MFLIKHTLLHFTFKLFLCCTYVCSWKSQDVYIDSLLASSNADEIQKLRDSEAKLQQQLQESVKRENVLNMKLTTKHQEMQDLLVWYTCIKLHNGVLSLCTCYSHEPIIALPGIKIIKLNLCGLCL